MEKKYDNVLIVDDNEEILVALKIFLRKYFKDIKTLNTPSNLHHCLEKNNYDLILLDMNFKAGNRTGNEGLFWLKEILKIAPEAIVICITAYGAIQLAVQAMRLGATDFIEKPWNEEHLLASILRATKLNETKKKLVQLSEKNKQLSKQNVSNINFVKGTSPVMQSIWQTIQKIAPTDANVFITGENGTGKELCAKSIHNLSQRKDAPFVSVDLGSLSPSIFESELFGHVKGAFTNANFNKTGWFETANGGTLFLDEIGNLNLEQQTKLLTAIQKKEITPVGSNRKLDLDIRIISATNANIDDLIQSKKFREDLLYRLNTIHIKMPPLTDRKEDIPLLADFYLNKFKRKYNKPNLKYTPAIMKRLQQYTWPGNIRELKHSIEKAIIMSENNKLAFSDIYSNHSTKNQSNNILTDGSSYNLEAHEKQLILDAIHTTKGNYSKAAELLGISRRTLYNKLERYDI